MQRNLVNFIQWKGIEVGPSFEIQIKPEFCAIACIMPLSHSQGSKIGLIDESELIKLLPHQLLEWKELLTQSNLNLKDIREIRILFHNPILIQKVRTACEALSIPFGKSIEMNSKATLLFQFLPQEGRIRVQKEKVSQPLKKKIRVIIVDDSETIQKLLVHILEKDSEIECIKTIGNPLELEAALIKLKPDVITLDIHMPEMDGVTVLKKILPRYPIPVIMISSLSKDDGSFVFDALENGAVDYIQKPSLAEVEEVSHTIREKIKSAAKAKIKISSIQTTAPSQKIIQKSIKQGGETNVLVAIGSSTGGPEALKLILTQLPDKIPPILIVQHIPKMFSKTLAERFNQLCPFEVKEAESGDEVKSNRVLVAPGGLQMKVVRNGNHLSVVIEDSEPTNTHKPSVNVLFKSMIEIEETKIVAAILTGMGSDGAQGLLGLRNKGAWTLAQDEASCIVFGMPKEAIRINAAKEVVPLEQMANRLLHACSAIDKKPVE